MKEANTSRPCGPVDRHPDRQTAPKSYPSDPLPALRSKELFDAKLSPRHPAPKSDMTKIEPSFELHGNDRTKCYTALRLRRAIRQRAPHAHAPRASARTASFTPRDPEGTLSEPAATAWSLRERSAGRAGRLKVPKNLSAGRSRSWRPQLSLRANTGSLA